MYTKLNTCQLYLACSRVSHELAMNAINAITDQFGTAIIAAVVSDRKTCQCKQHENLLFVAQSQQKVVACPTDDIETMTEAIVCESSSISCMYGLCAECKEK